MPSRHLVQLLIFDQGLRLLQRVVDLSDPRPDYARRCSGGDTPEVSSIAEVLRHHRIAHPLSKHRVRQDRAHSVREATLRLAAELWIGAGDFTGGRKTRGSQPVSSLPHFVKETEANHAAADIAAADARTIKFDVDPLG